MLLDSWRMVTGHMASLVVTVGSETIVAFCLVAYQTAAGRLGKPHSAEESMT